MTADHHEIQSFFPSFSTRHCKIGSNSLDTHRNLTPKETPMATLDQFAANTANAQSSTGPITEEGKAASSKNAITSGLFTAGALIRPGEEPLYTELEESLQTELCPATVMEDNLVEEILGAMWRLRRCRLAESSLAAVDDDSASRRQTSVDRARSQASRLLYKATAELRRLQTERFLRNEILPQGTDLTGLGVCDMEKVVRARRKSMEDCFSPLPDLTKNLDFTKRTQNPPPPTPETPQAP